MGSEGALETTLKTASHVDVLYQRLDPQNEPIGTGWTIVGLSGLSIFIVAGVLEFTHTTEPMARLLFLGFLALATPIAVLFWIATLRGIKSPPQAPALIRSAILDATLLSRVRGRGPRQFMFAEFGAIGVQRDGPRTYVTLVREGPERGLSRGPFCFYDPDDRVRELLREIVRSDGLRFA